MNTKSWFYIKFYANTTKRDILFNIVLSLILSVAIVCATRIKYENKNIYGGLYNVNYVSDFGFSAFVLGSLLFVIIMLMLPHISEYINRLVDKGLAMAEAADNKKIILIWGIIILFAWLPYYLSYYPGGLFYDTYISIDWAKNGTLSNFHPVFYTWLLGLALHTGEMFGKDLYWSIGLFTAVQMLLMQCEFLYFVHWMLRYRIKKSIRIVLSALWVFFPLIPLYGVSVWKDTPFSMAFFFWMLFVIDLYIDAKNQIFNKKTVLGFCIGGILVAFTRNNGIYVICLTIIVFGIVFIKSIINHQTDKNEKIRRIVLSSLIMVFSIIFIQGSVYYLIGISQTQTVESFGIPLQQIAAVIAYDGEITEEQKGILNNYIPRIIE